MEEQVEYRLKYYHYILIAAASLAVSVAWFFMISKCDQIYHNTLDFALVECASKGDAREMENLLSRGANPHAIHIEGASAIWLAVDSRSPKCVDILLAHGVSPSEQGKHNTIKQALNNLANDNKTARHSDIVILADLIKHSAPYKPYLTNKANRKWILKALAYNKEHR